MNYPNFYDFKHYKIFFCLQQIAAEVSAPLSQCKKVTMVSSGKSEIGASKLTGEVLDIIAKVPQVVSQLTGVNITHVSNFLICLCVF